MLVAALMGAGGVIVAAAGAHLGGGESSRIAADFLLIHAGTIIGLCGVSLAGLSASCGLLIAGTILAVGATMFGVDLALASLVDLRPFPLAAPIGGFGMIVGWLAIGVAALGLVRARSKMLSK